MSEINKSGQHQDEEVRAGQEETGQVGNNQEGTGQETRNQEGSASAGPVESAGQVDGSTETMEHEPGDNKTTERKPRNIRTTEHDPGNIGTTEHKKPRDNRGSKPGSPGHNKTGAGLPTTVNPGKPGDNARFIRYALASWDLPPIDISDPEQVKNRILEYLNYCAENDRKPQIIGMANWLGVGRDVLNDWKRGITRRDTHAYIVQKAIALLEEQWIDYMQCGKVNPAAGIFLAKNWFGYRDVQDVVVTPSAPYEAGSAEDVAKQYIDGMVGYETVDSDGSVE